jgi:Holliday junction resolvase
MASQYSYGRSGENKIAKILRRKGYSVSVSKGSRGGTDIRACKGSKKYNLQVKRTRKNRAPSVSANDLKRLKASARRQKAVPVIAKMVRGRVTYWSARIKRKIKP